MKSFVQGSLLALAACIAIGFGSGLAPPAAGAAGGDLLVEVPCGTLETARWLSQFDVRLAAPGKLLLQVSSRDLAAIGAAGLECRTLDSVEAGEEYYCCSTSARVPEGFSVVWVSRRDGAQVVVGRAPEGAIPFARHAAVPLPHDAAATSWFRTPPPDAAVGRVPGARATAAAAQVNAENIEKIINDLSYDAAAETLRTRYSLRRETAEIALPYVRDLLSANLDGAGTVETQEFPMASGENPPMAYNVIGTVPGAVEGAGYYILSAHYDAIGSRTAYPDGRAWDPSRDPAPGADDNASGVATVLECARVLAHEPLDFGLKFILFSGEEQGIKGSTYYVKYKEEDPIEGPLLGVFNSDMVAYNPAGDTLQVVTDALSSWMADFVVESYGELKEEIGELSVTSAQKLRYPFSDDGAFQTKGYPAVTLIEERDVEESNPYYHTIGDNNLNGRLNISQATKAAKLLAGSLAALSTSMDAPDLEVTPGDISFAAAGVLTATRADVGDTVTVSVRVRNVGGPSGVLDPPDLGRIHLRLYDGDPDYGADVLGEADFTGSLPALGGRVFKVTWPVGESERGSHRITAVVSLTGDDELDLDNNRAVTPFSVVDRTMDLLEQYVFPNPVDPRGGSSFHYFLTQPAAVTIEVFDVVGRSVGSVGRPKYGGRIPGVNFMEIAVPIEDVIYDPADLPGGVYFYRIAADDGTVRRERSGRFIVVR
jgi:hypothetical protein